MYDLDALFSAPSTQPAEHPIAFFGRADAAQTVNLAWPRKGCRCYTQQATRIDMAQDTCKMIVERGWFDDTLADRPAQVAVAQVPAQPRNGASGPPQPLPAPGQVDQPGDVSGPSNPVLLSATAELPRQATEPAGSQWRAR